MIGIAVNEKTCALNETRAYFFTASSWKLIWHSIRNAITRTSPVKLLWIRNPRLRYIQILLSLAKFSRECPWFFDFKSTNNAKGTILLYIKTCIKHEFCLLLFWNTLWVVLDSQTPYWNIQPFQNEYTFLFNV